MLMDVNLTVSVKNVTTLNYNPHQTFQSYGKASYAGITLNVTK